MSDRPWLCPESRCTPLLNLRDGDYKDITVAEPGHSFTCWGRMAEAVTFIEANQKVSNIAETRAS